MRGTKLDELLIIDAFWSWIYRTDQMAIAIRQPCWLFPQPFPHKQKCSVAHIYPHWHSSRENSWLPTLHISRNHYIPCDRVLVGHFIKQLPSKSKISHLDTCTDHCSLTHQIRLTNWWKHPIASSQATQSCVHVNWTTLNMWVMLKPIFRNDTMYRRTVPCANSWAEVQTKNVKAWLSEAR